MPLQLLLSRWPVTRHSVLLWWLLNWLSCLWPHLLLLDVRPLDLHVRLLVMCLAALLLLLVVRLAVLLLLLPLGLLVWLPQWLLVLLLLDLLPLLLLLPVTHPGLELLLKLLVSRLRLLLLQVAAAAVRTAAGSTRHARRLLRGHTLT